MSKYAVVCVWQDQNMGWPFLNPKMVTKIWITTKGF
jgi:hypothetical protein